jgi:tetratricopeptide (TPR) repeat protein
MAKIKRLILGLGLWAAAPALFAQPALSPDELFAQGNDAYRAGQFDAAREAYETIVRQGLSSASLCFNLGNAYYRLGQAGRARLWYERAARLDPGDDDTRHNLSLVKARVQDTEPGTGLSGFLQRRSAALRWGFLFANVFFFAVLAAGLLRETEALWWGRWIAGVFFLVASGLLFLERSQGRAVRAIVLEARAEVRSSPDPEAAVGFVVPEGHEVVLFRALHDWVEVGAPQKGVKGWVKRDAVEPIPPQPSLAAG